MKIFNNFGSAILKGIFLPLQVVKRVSKILDDVEEWPVKIVQQHSYHSKF